MWTLVTVALIFRVILRFELTFDVNISIYGSQFSFTCSFHSYTVYMRIEVVLGWLCGIYFDQDTFFYNCFILITVTLCNSKNLAEPYMGFVLNL